MGCSLVLKLSIVQALYDIRTRGKTRDCLKLDLDPNCHCQEPWAKPLKASASGVHHYVQPFLTQKFCSIIHTYQINKCFLLFQMVQKTKNSSSSASRNWLKLTATETTTLYKHGEQENISQDIKFWCGWVCNGQETSSCPDPVKIFIEYISNP